MSLILVSHENRVATVTLNRPERLNAVSKEMYDELNGVLREIDADGEIRAVVLTGAGRAFCSGGDVKGMEERLHDGMTEGARRSRYLHQTGRTIENLVALRKPLIAAVNGPAVGVGMGIAAAADVRIASEDAVFGLPFAQRGLVPDGGSTYLLPQLIGIGNAMRLALTCEPLKAEEALRIGLVSEVVPPDLLLSRCQEVAQQIARHAPLAVQATKAAMRFQDVQGVATAVALEANEQCRLQGTEDHREGVLAFLEKRSPEFVGR